VVDHNYGGRSVDEVGDTLGSLDDVGAALRILRNLAGETWYLLVASFGILGLLVLVEGPAIVGKLRRCELGAPSLSLILLLVATAGLLLVTAVWFVDPTRPDQIVYGRYIEPTVPPLLALGVVALMRGASRPAFGIVLGGVAVLTVVVAVLAAGLPDLPGEEANRWSVSSLPFVTGELGPAVIIGAGVVAAAGAWAIAATAARAPWAGWTCGRRPVRPDHGLHGGEARAEGRGRGLSGGLDEPPVLGRSALRRGRLRHLALRQRRGEGLPPRIR
jgi:hypothetical protein